VTAGGLKIPRFLVGWMRSLDVNPVLLSRTSMDDLYVSRDQLKQAVYRALMDYLMLKVVSGDERIRVGFYLHVKRVLVTQFSEQRAVDGFVFSVSRYPNDQYQSHEASHLEEGMRPCRRTYSSQLLPQRR
jgi:hypothetical protein